MQTKSIAKIIWTSIILVVIFTISTNINNSVAKSQNSFYTDSATVHLDKTDIVIGDYFVMIENTQTGKYVENLYTDSKDGSRYIDISGDLKVKIGQTLIACTMQLDTKEAACDTQIANGDDTEFNINMADGVPIENNAGNTDGFKGNSVGNDNYNANNYDTPSSSLSDSLANKA